MEEVIEIDDGIQAVFSGGAPCGSNNYTFTAKVECSKHQTGKGNGRIIKVEGAETCNPTVYISH